MTRKLKNSFIILALIGGLEELAAKISDLRLCADAECKDLIGLGRTVLRYHAPESNMLSFGNNQEVKIFSKEAGSNLDLWGVMIDGRRGYVHKKHIQEQKVYKKDLKFEVPTATASNTPKKEDEKDVEQVQPRTTSPGQETNEPVNSIEITHSHQVETVQRQPQLGDHAKQVTLSPEDMEYNRVKSSYSNTNGDYVLEANLLSTNGVHVVEPINEDHLVEANKPVASTDGNHVLETNIPMASSTGDSVVEATDGDDVLEDNLHILSTNRDHVLEAGLPLASTNRDHLVEASVPVESLPLASTNGDHLVEARVPPLAATNGDHLVEASVPVEATPALDSVSVNPTIAVIKNLDVIDGTSIYLGSESSAIVDKQMISPILPTMTSVPKPATEVPEIQSSVVSQGENINLSEQILDAEIKQPVDLKQASPTKLESIGVPVVEITTPVPDDVPNTSENKEVVPSHTVVYTPPEYPSNFEVKPSEVVVEALKETVDITKENNYVTHDEYKDVETDDDEVKLEGMDQDVNELSSSIDDEEEEDEEEEFEENDEDRKVDFQAHIDNLKKAYLDQIDEKYPSDEKPIEENMEDQLKMSVQEVSEEILDKTESEIGNDKLPLNVDTTAPEMPQPIHSSYKETSSKSSTSENPDLLSSKSAFSTNEDSSQEGTRAQSAASSSDEVVTPTNIQVEYKTEEIQEIPPKRIENTENGIGNDKLLLNADTTASEVTQPIHSSYKETSTESSRSENPDLLSSKSTSSTNEDSSQEGTRDQSSASSLDEVVTLPSIQTEHKNEEIQEMTEKIVENTGNRVGNDKLLLNSDSTVSEMSQAINSSTEETLIESSTSKSPDLLASKSSFLPNEDSSQDIGAQSAATLPDGVVSLSNIQMEYKTEEITQIPEKILENAENEVGNDKLPLNTDTTGTEMPLAINSTTEETPKESSSPEIPDLLSSKSSFFTNVDSSHEDIRGESALTSSDEVITLPSIQAEYKTEEIQQLDILTVDKNMASSKNENIDKKLNEELNMDTIKENINPKEIDNRKVQEAKNNEDIFNSSRDIKFHMPGDVEYSLPPLSNDGQNITFHSPNDFADNSASHLPSQADLADSHSHTPNEFIDIGDSQPDTIVFQYKEEDKSLYGNQQNYVHEQIQTETPYQNSEQSTYNHQSNVALQDDPNQQEEGIVKSATQDILSSVTITDDHMSTSTNSLASDTKLASDADIRTDEDIGDTDVSTDKLIVNPEGRDVQLTFHGDTDIIVKQSKENVTNTIEEANTGNTNLPDALAMTVLPNEDVAGKMIPPITAGVEQEYKYVEWLMQFVPSWLHSLSHGPRQPAKIGISGDQMCLLAIVAVTLLFLYLINQCLEKASREKPLIAKVAELDKKLFNVQNELLITKTEIPEKEVVAYDPAFIEHVGEMQQKLDESDKVLKTLKMEICQITCEKENADKECSKMNEYNGQLLIQLSEAQSQQQAALEKARQADEMMEEMIQLNIEKNNNEDHEKFISVVKNLQEQLEGQKIMLARYEPKYKKKEKEVKELSKESRQLKADLANARLNAEKMKKELTDATKINIEKEVEWGKCSGVLQSEMTEKIEAANKMEREVSRFKSLITAMENEVEAKEEQCEELQEMVNELEIKKKKQQTNDWEEGEGWDLQDEKSMDEVKEIAKLKVQARKAIDAKNKLEIEAEEMTKRISDLEQKLEVTNDECEFMRKSRDEVFKKGEATERQLEVLTEYFNKKETELQKQLGLQTAKFGNVSTDAESSAKKLLSVMSELESTQDALKAVRREIEEQEKSLKAEIASHEKRAHENWIAAKQVDRKLTDVQGEMSVLRNKLTTVEEKNASLELQNEDLQSTIQIIQQTKAEANNGHGLNASRENLYNSEVKPSPSSFTSNEATLPPLPGLDMNPSLSGLSSLPGVMGLPSNMMMQPPSNMMMQPMLPRPLMDTRLPPLGQMSPGPRERYSQRSPSPEFDRYRPHSPSSSRYGEFSPRSDRRSQRRPSPSRSEHGISSYRRGQRGPSPSRSERGLSPERRRRPLSPSQSDRGGSPYSQR